MDIAQINVLLIPLEILMGNAKAAIVQVIILDVLNVMEHLLINVSNVIVHFT